MNEINNTAVLDCLKGNHTGEQFHQEFWFSRDRGGSFRTLHGLVGRWRPVGAFRSRRNRSSGRIRRTGWLMQGRAPRVWARFAILQNRKSNRLVSKAYHLSARQQFGLEIYLSSQQAHSVLSALLPTVAMWRLQLWNISRHDIINSRNKEKLLKICSCNGYCSQFFMI